MRFSEDIIILEKGYWNATLYNSEVITYPEEYKETTSLGVACTQIKNLKAPEQKKLVEKWSETLPKLDKVKYLFLQSKVPQIIFESACLMPNLAGLYIKWSGITDISSLIKLRNIRYFHLGSSTRLESIDILKNMENLIYLGLENIKKISNIEPLLNLKNLIALYLEGSMWTTQVVETLKPLSNLHKLRHLRMANLKTHDKTIEFLGEMKNLKYLNGPAFFSKGFNYQNEINNLWRKNPNLIIDSRNKNGDIVKE